MYLFYDKSIHHNSLSSIPYPQFLYYKIPTSHQNMVIVELLGYRAIREYRPLFFQSLIDLYYNVVIFINKKYYEITGTCKTQKNN